MKKTILKKSIERLMIDLTPKAVVPRLPSNWVNLVLNKQQKIHDMQPQKNQGLGLHAISFMAAFGCTPDEMERGLRVKADATGWIGVFIGATNKPYKGHLAKRIIIIDAKSSFNRAAQILWDHYSQAEYVGRHHDFAYKANTLSKLINSLTTQFIEEVLSRRDEKSTRITSTTFRHQLSADLCGTGQYEASEIASILGLNNVSSLADYALTSKTPVKPIRPIILQQSRNV